MTWVNYDDALNQIRDAGLLIDKGLSMDARIQRWKVDGEDHEKRGWTKLREWQSKAGNTYIVGAFGVWRGNDDGYTKIEFSKDSSTALTAEDKAAIKAAHKEAERKLAEVRRGEIKKAAQWAASVWNKCAPCEAHDYLTIKQIKPHGLRILPDDFGNMTLAGIDESNFFRIKSAAGALVVPMHNAKGEIQGLQFVYAKGHPRRAKIERDKEFWPSGMAMGGTFGLIGPVRRDGIMLIAEGYATAASLAEATGQTTAYAFSANNLVKAGKELIKAYPLLRVLFCADDDYLTDGNPGCSAAANACAEIERSAWVKPEFPKNADGTDARNGKKLTDYNDLHVMTGLSLTLAEQINAKLDELKWRDATPRSKVETTGEGEAQLAMLTPDEVVSRFSPVWSTEDVYYFDHRERVVCSRQSLAARMPRSGWDQVTSHPDWRTKLEVPLSGVDFDPTESDREVVYNLWGGWKKITRPPGAKCDSILAMLHHLCSFEQASHQVVYEWILNWLAFMMQNPGAKMQSCILMHGSQGAGKNTFFDAVLEIFSNEYSVQFGPKQLEKRFNALFSKKMFAIGNEIVASREDLYHVKGHIKHMITERRWVVEAKNKDERWERNCCNFVFLSNELNPQALDKGDRRHCVIWTPHVPEPHEDSYAIWQKLWSEAHAERKNGGHAALYYYLMQRDLTGFTEATWPPMTQAKQDLIDINMDSRERFWRGYMEESIEGIPCVPCTVDDFYSAYRAWTSRAGISRCAPAHSLQAFVGKQPNMIRRQERFAIGHTMEKKTVIHPYNLTDPPLDKTKSAWLGECVTEFRKFLTYFKGN